MSTLIKLFNKLLYNFSAEAEYKRRYNKMHEFLSQATDRLHLEQLEREWDRNQRNRGWY